MKTFVVSTLLVLFTLELNAQSPNLVLNPGFETLRANEKLDQINNLSVLENWTSPALTTPMLFTTVNGNIYDPHGSLWPFRARSGANVAGINVYGGTDVAPLREYIQGKLSRPLTQGKKYYFSFYVHYHCEGASSIGIAFLPGKMAAEAVGILPLQPVSWQRELNKYAKGEKTWALVRDSFIAYQPFTHFVIGNFFSNQDTRIESNGFDHHFAYIDDVEITEAPDASLPVVDSLEQRKWQRNIELAAAAGVATPKPAALTVYFDFDKSTLRKEEVARLDSLATLLLAQPALKLDIIGHASSEGADQYNLALSQKRAERVHRYLIRKGIPAQQLNLGARGEKEPVAANNTPEGRAQNRRALLIPAGE